MAEPFLSEIRLMSFSYAPKGWAMANGQLMPIAQNAELFSRLGTFYGGDGKTSFALPNLQASAPIGAGATFFIAMRGIFPSRSTPRRAGHR